MFSIFNDVEKIKADKQVSTVPSRLDSSLPVPPATLYRRAACHSCALRARRQKKRDKEAKKLAGKKTNTDFSADVAPSSSNYEKKMVSRRHIACWLLAAAAAGWLGG